jgi:tetraacyldisaccharide 4'-kinase|tara:strand:+ start:104 stop:1042 length:939 start_codon:yes stop_codon:yes gene_type:complete
MIIKISKPKFWDKKEISYLTHFLRLFSFPILINNYFQRKKIKFNDIKTICVGNIYIGGTGKTPTCINLNSIITQLKYKTAFVKKYYKNQLDEQIILKKKSILFCEKERIMGLKNAIENKIKVAIFDDGLQDNKIDYDLKFVCFNTLNWIGNGLLIPAGPLREKLESLKKYNAVFLNGNNERTDEMEKTIKKYNNEIKIFKAEYILDNINEIDIEKKYISFSGIGSPSSFLKTLKNNNINIIKNINFPDHHNYSKNEIENIKKEAKLLNTNIITTEKDFVKLNQEDQKKIKCAKIKLVIKNENVLKEYLKSLL